jgi:hypothetical protein
MPYFCKVRMSVSSLVSRGARTCLNEDLNEHEATALHILEIQSSFDRPTKCTTDSVCIPCLES